MEPKDVWYNSQQANFFEEREAELAGVVEEILEKLVEAEGILREVGGDIQERAMSYWVPHIYQALQNETRWLGGSMITAEDTINEIENMVEDLRATPDEEEEEEEEEAEA